jgi:type II secretory pathway predicted ATPase ExeA
MYLNFYGFIDKPFEVTPDPKFLFITPGYQEILSALIYGIHERRGFIAVVGEVGTGKTLMLNALLDRLDRKHKVAFIFNSDLTFKQILMMVLCDIGQAEPEERISKVDAIQRLNSFAIKQLERDGNVVIIIDEAQNISDKTMENIRMLSNLETRKHKLVQIVLCGQPELDEKLSRYEWRQLVQRISLKRYAMTLHEEETYRYIQHRLDIAGYKGSSLFSQGSQKLIWEFSGGIPRKINILCDNALLIGYGLAKENIDEDIVNEAIHDLSWSPYLSHLESRESLSIDTSAPYPEEKQSAAASEMRSQNLAEEKDATYREIQFTDGEQTASMLVETRSPDTAEAQEDGLKAGFHRKRSSLIAGFLILVCLIIIVWFLITGPKLDLGANIFPRRQNITQTEPIEQLNGSFDQPDKIN